MNPYHISYFAYRHLHYTFLLFAGKRVYIGGESVNPQGKTKITAIGPPNETTTDYSLKPNISNPSKLPINGTNKKSVQQK